MTVEKAIRAVRAAPGAAHAGDERVSIVTVFPHGFPARTIDHIRQILKQSLREGGVARDLRDFGGDGLGPGPRDLLWDGRDDRGRPFMVTELIVGYSADQLLKRQPKLGC